MTPRASGQRRGGLGLRREVLVLLPAALLLLVVLSTFTLFSYRGALARFAEDRREEAARVARAVAGRLAGGAAGSQDWRIAGGLGALAPGARGVALLDAAGVPLAAAGELPPLPPPSPPGSAPAVLAVGPDERLPDAVAGFALLAPGAPGAGAGGDAARASGRRWVRVDLPAAELGRQLAEVQVLSWLVIGVDGALTLLVLLFLRRLLQPYEALLERARQLGAAPPPAGDEGEVEFLVATFERALAGLAGRDGRRVEDDIAALERTLSASLQSGLLLLDREGRVLALNAVGASLLGAPATPPAPPGAALAELLAGQPALLGLLGPAVAAGRALTREECAVRAGEESRTLGLTAHPLRRDDGEVRGTLVLFADLTAVLRQADESRLAESLASLGELAGGVAHELRNSLATLRGYLTLIERRPEEESITGYLQEIRREADQLQRVLEDFLSFARPGTARVEELVLAEIVLRAAADPVLAGVELRTRRDGAAIRLRGDPQLLERALRNLLHNAVEAEREAGRRGPVEVGVEVQAEGVEVVIDDRGGGLTPALRERLFHPFASGRRGGAGLGLALAQRIVLLHGGRIRLDDRPDGGTRARVFFPADTLVTESPKVGSPDQSPDR